MSYSTAVTFAVARVLTTLTRLLKPLGSAEKLQVLDHVIGAASSLRDETGTDPVRKAT